MDDSYTNFGSASVFVFLAMFGGSTFILFLLCYFCQKKLQEGDVAMGNYDTGTRQVYVIPTRSHLLPMPHSSPPMPYPPPPDYGSVVKKPLPEIPVFKFDCEPPPYETAIGVVMSQTIAENGESTNSEKRDSCAIPMPS